MRSPRRWKRTILFFLIVSLVSFESLLHAFEPAPWGGWEDLGQGISMRMRYVYYNEVAELYVWHLQFRSARPVFIMYQLTDPGGDVERWGVSVKGMGPVQDPLFRSAPEGSDFDVRLTEVRFDDESKGYEKYYKGTDLERYDRTITRAAEFAETPAGREAKKARGAYEECLRLNPGHCEDLRLRAQQTYAVQRRAILAALESQRTSPPPERKASAAAGGNGPTLEVTEYLGSGNQQTFSVDCDNVDGYIRTAEETLGILSWIVHTVERKRTMSPPFNKLSDHEADTYKAYKSKKSVLEELREFERNCP